MEWWDDEQQAWVFTNVPPSSAVGNTGLCSYDVDHGCNYDNTTGCSAISGGPGAAMQDHEIFAVTWAVAGDVDAQYDDARTQGPVLDAANLRLTDGSEVSPLPWASQLTSPLGVPLKNDGLRLVNRTFFYRCRE